MKAFLEALAKTCNVKMSCAAAGIDRRTAYRHRGADEEFAELWDDAVDDGVDMLAAEARRRAAGYRRDILYKGKKIAEEMIYSDLLLMFLLKAHRPEQFRDNYDLGKALDGLGKRSDR
jgi:hypothetical protein